MIFCRRMKTAGIVFPLQQEYRKWLRFYLDFCNKYFLAPADRDTPGQFMQKLNEKGQSFEKQKQAYQSVKVYLDIVANELKPDEKQKASEENEATAAYSAREPAGWSGCIRRFPGRGGRSIRGTVSGVVCRKCRTECLL